MTPCHFPPQSQIPFLFEYVPGSNPTQNTFIQSTGLLNTAVIDHVNSQWGFHLLFLSKKAHYPWNLQGNTD